MKRLTVVLIVTILAAWQVAARGQHISTEDHRALRAQLEERFDIVPLTDGVGLRPKARSGDVRLIEINDGSILVNGAPVTGQELKQRIGADADAVLRVSYLSSAARQTLLDDHVTTRDETVEAAPPLEKTTGDPDTLARRPRHSSGDRVRVFGDVMVREDESVSGQIVAVLGSVRIDGEVGDQVVAVLGSVDLGPKAVVRGDVVSVGGRVRRADGAQIRGGVTEVSVSDPNVRVNFHPLFDWRDVYPFDALSAVPRLVGTIIRFLLLVLLASIALVVARPTVEASAQRVSDSPVQTTLVGIAAQVLLIPAVMLTSIVLAISIIGIPLLLFLPFAILALILLALAGFSGTVYAVGQWTRRRMGIGGAAPFLDVFIGVMVILLPVLVARLISLVAWPAAPLAILLLMIGFAVEFVAWSSGFGAVLANSLARWQARRSARAQPPVVS